MGTTQTWTRLGWQGIAFAMPGDWCPGRLQGDHAEGYLRIEDEVHVRLELRWESVVRGGGPAEQFVDRYLKQAAKKLRGRGQKPEVERGFCLPKLDGIDHEAFVWNGQFNAHSLVAVCSKTKRIVHLRVFSEEGADRRALARRIFESLQVGPQEGTYEWGVFDFGFRLPDSWRLDSSALRTGCLQLEFRDGRDQLRVSRFSLAELVLRKSGFAAWFARAFEKVLRRFDYTVREDEYRGHRALHGEGSSKVRARPFGLFRRKRHLTALAWHCQELDKIFAVRLVADEAHDKRVRACTDTISCP